jgi:two-component sensor histidine kinase
MTATPQPQLALELAVAVVASSASPLLLMDGDMRLLAASDSFYAVFELSRADTVGRPVFELDDDRWAMPRLRSVLAASLTAGSAIEAYELDLDTTVRGTRKLVVKVQRLAYAGDPDVRVLMSVADVTDARAAESTKDELIREKAVLIQEVQHRVANSLQIIASVLMQSARRVQSEEARRHLHDAHHRVMSIASVQDQLAVSGVGEVAMRPYLTQLCQSIGASMIHEPDHLVLSVRSDDVSVPPNVSVSLGLIVTELVINALKHAFEDGRPGRIDVDYSAQAADWTLAVADDGIGMPPAPDLAASGLGSSIVAALAKQLKARISVQDNAPGTAVSVIHAHSSSVAERRDEMPDTIAV